MFKRELTSSYLYHGGNAVLTIVLMPFYAHYLGVAVVGIISIFAIVQSILTIFEFGFRPVMVRSFAKYFARKDSAFGVLSLFKTYEILIVIIGILLTFMLVFYTNFFIDNWFSAEGFGLGELKLVFEIMSIVLGMRFVEGAYLGCLVAMRRMILFNTVNLLIMGCKGVGSILLLYVYSGDLFDFFIFQLCISFASLFSVATLVHLHIPKARKKPVFSLIYLKRNGDFIWGVLGISSLTICLAHLDKILISKLLGFSDYGYYVMAATLAAGLNIFIQPISQLMFSRLSQSYASGDRPRFIREYHFGSRLIASMIFPLAFVLIALSELIFKIWLGGLDYPKNMPAIFSFLIVGNLIAGLFSMPLQAEISRGRTGLIVRLNIFFVLCYCFGLYYSVPFFGVVSAVIIFCILNLINLCVGVYLVHGEVLSEAWVDWLYYGIFIPFLPSFFIYLILQFIDTSWVESAASYLQIAYVVFAVVVSMLLSLYIFFRLNKRLNIIL
jgi:O-antigen/teichoic acid export membrane protein